MKLTYLLPFLLGVFLVLGSSCGSTKTVVERQADADREIARAPLQVELDETDAAIDALIGKAEAVLDDGVIDADEAAMVGQLKALLTQADDLDKRINAIDDEQITADRAVAERETNMVKTMFGKVFDWLPGSAPVKGSLMTLLGIAGTAYVEGRGKRKIRGMGRAAKRRSLGMLVGQLGALFGIGSGDSDSAAESSVAKYEEEGKPGAAILVQRVHQLQAAGLVSANGQLSPQAAAALLGVQAPPPPTPQPPAPEPTSPTPEAGA